MRNIGNFLVRFSAVLFCCIALYFLMVSIAGNDESDTSIDNQSIVIDKGEIDKRQYHYLTLSNKLRVLLISDQEADKAAASLDVNVGSSDDPKDRNGLAHFLEHMLFLGTEKYPDAAEYQAFIDRNGGGHNAYTSPEHTNYFFDVKADQLEPALDRFAQFFVAPLFDEVYVDRERKAVHSEYQAKIKDDNRRDYDVYRKLINPDHPYANFSVGSLQTLADKPGDKVRDDLLEFYQQHYSSDRMTLVVLGKETIPQLQAMVEKRFSQIPLRKVQHTRPTIPLFLPDQLPIEVVSRPVQNMRQMTMLFPLPSIKDYYGEKPLNYIGFLLGHEGQGSVLSVLKERGWAEALAAGGSDGGAGNATFSIRITLTEEGVKQRDKIRALVFHALDVIRKQGVEAWRYKEEQRLAAIAFQFRESGRAISAVRSLADSLHNYPVAEVISADYLYSSFNAELIQTFLAKMTPENLYVSTLFPEAETDKVTYHYQVPYQVHRLATSAASITDSLKNQYTLPKNNIFIPESSQLFAEDKKLSQPQATSIAAKDNDKESTLWVKQDLSFGVPKAGISVRVKSPIISQSLRAAAMGDLLTTLIEDRLNENSYPAQIAGLAYSLSPNTRGFDLSISGYDNKMDLLLSMLVKEIQNPDLKEERFNNLKVELLRQLRNGKKQTPFRQLMGQLPVTLLQPYWSDEQIANELETVTFNHIKQFATQWLNGAQLQALFYGNIKQSLVDQWTDKITSLLLPGKDVIAPTKVAKLVAEASAPIKEKTISVDHNDKAVVLYSQGVTDTLEDQAKMVLLRQVLESDFYNQLRTEQQLGYIVFLTSLTIKDLPGSAFVVQSPGTPVEGIKSAITQFLSQSATAIPDDLSLYQRSAAAKLLEKPQQLSAQMSLYWQDILRGDESFSYRKRLVEAIDKVTPQQLRNYYQQTMLDKQRLLWIVADKAAVDKALPLFADSQPYYSYP